MKRRRAATIALILMCALTRSITGEARAAAALPPPPDLLARVGFEPRLGMRLPLDVSFRDAQSATVRLRDALGGRPAVLILGYYGCTNLCTVVRTGVAKAVTASGFRPGAEFNLVLLSIDPRESAADAAVAQRSDARAHPFARVAQWRYLTGAPAADDAVARALGFRYLFEPRDGAYAHAAGIVIVSPQGTITQYLPGVQFSPVTLRLALVDASHGRIGTVIDRLVLLCCDYDSSTGRYNLVIGHALQVMAILTLVALGGLILALRRAEVRAREVRP